MYRLRAKRTTGSNPPTEMLFGELAYSDANKRLYVGRSNGSLATFESDLSLAPITESIAVLSTDLDTLRNSQTVQADTIALISSTLDSQADLLGQLSAASTNQGDYLITFAANVQSALESKANTSGLSLVAFSGAYGDLTGLPTLFSGAYADLSNKPTITFGFTYDQVLEPSGPVAGATWRERSSGGRIVGEWEWSGSAWIGLTKYWASINALAAISASTGTAADSLMPFHGVFLLEKVVFNYGLAAAPDTTNYWQVMMSMVNYAGSGAATGNPEIATTVSLNTVSTGETSQTYNLLITAGRTRIKVTKFAAAPNINRIAMFYQWRAVR